MTSATGGVAVAKALLDLSAVGHAVDLDVGIDEVVERRPLVGVAEPEIAAGGHVDPIRRMRPVEELALLREECVFLTARE